MSDDTGSTAPRRPAPDPFYLAVAHDLGLDPGQVIAGTMRLEWDDGATLRGRTGEVRISWQGSATLAESTVDRVRTVAEAQGLRDGHGCGTGTIAEAQGVPDQGTDHLPTQPTDPDIELPSVQWTIEYQQDDGWHSHARTFGEAATRVALSEFREATDYPWRAVRHEFVPEVVEAW